MTDTKPDDKAKGAAFSTRDMIYGAIVVVGFVLIVTGVNGAMNLGLSETMANTVGAIVGVVAAFVLTWLRKR